MWTDFSLVKCLWKPYLNWVCSDVGSMGTMGALDPIDKILWGYGPMEFYTSYIIDNYGLRLTAQYIIRCTLMVCGLRSSCTSHIYKNYKLFWIDVPSWSKSSPYAYGMYKTNPTTEHYWTTEKIGTPIKCFVMLTVYATCP